MELDQDFSEFVQLFLDNDVRFLIVGGYAMAAHGLPRFTGDLDTWVWIDHENAERIMKALTEFQLSGHHSQRFSVAKPCCAAWFSTTPD